MERKLPYLLKRINNSGAKIIFIETEYVQRNCPIKIMPLILKERHFCLNIAYTLISIHAIWPLRVGKDI
jgi:hypothetical protein